MCDLNIIILCSMTKDISLDVIQTGLDCALSSHLSCCFSIAAKRIMPHESHCLLLTGHREDTCVI